MCVCVCDWLCPSGSPAQLCHLQAGDEIVSLGGQRVAEMSYEQWKANMDAALREGKLLMDIRRLSLNGGDCGVFFFVLFCDQNPQ